MSLFGPRPPYSVLYAAGDSLTDYGNFIPLITPPGMDATLREELLYSLSITNLQGDIDGDGQDDGVSYPQTAVWTLGLAGDIVNVAVATARAIGSRTVEQSLRNGTDPGGTVSLFDFAGADLTPEQRAYDINLTAQVDRIIADFEERGAPANAAVTLLVGANDLADVVAGNADLFSGAVSIETVLAILPEFAATMAGIVETTVEAALRLDAAGVDTIVYLTSPIANVPLVNRIAAPVPAIADILMELQNAVLGAALSALTLRPDFDAQVKTVDVAALVSAVEADPSNFNIQAFAEPYYEASSPYPVDEGGALALFEPVNPDFPFAAPDDRSFFFDILHPNANAHDLIAAFLDASLTGTVTFGGDAGGFTRDTLFSGDDLMIMGGGNDAIVTDRGADIVFAGAGNDTVNGGRGDDILAGGSGNDALHGGAGPRLFGIRLPAGNDILDGHDGNDTLDGGSGHDALFDGLGSDLVRGGRGNDLLVHVDEPLLGGTAANAADIDVFDGGPGWDTLLLILPDAGDRTLVIDAIDASRGFGGAIGDVSIPALGLAFTGIERVVIVEERALPAGLDIAPALAERLALADLWTVGLPAREDFSVADALYDSAIFLA
ncbi:hypothetical protein L1787_21655 [Acuticoccus sp. M5D2P5]|uniref:hypothetical protein n=1 Tax=Acuticoccus kalidii TaxID=2910977 RepID=UPI001F2FDF83|nr:hypothetical protein [Acuticoccus kalidii]MCF3936000.1 hypothetical protein [Acuticoccus kalidii]